MRIALIFALVVASSIRLSAGDADFAVERRVLMRFADRIGSTGDVTFREGGDAAHPETFSIHSEAGRTVIEGPTRRARLYGLGRHLREPFFCGSSALARRWLARRIC